MAEHQVVYAGIDVCQERLDLAFWPGGNAGPFAYDPKGLQDLRAALQQQHVSLVVLEATGGLELRRGGTKNPHVPPRSALRNAIQLVAPADMFGV